MVAETAVLFPVLFPGLEGHWFGVQDGDLRVAALLRRHYSARRDGVRGRSDGFAGPGEKIVLLTPQCDAIWVWRAERFRRDGQTGINCAVFRNEGLVLSSDLIREACEIAWRRWPGERLYTFVWDAKVKTSEQRGRNKAGWCYRKAGWRVCGRNADGRLTILEILPTEGHSADRSAGESTQEVHPQIPQDGRGAGSRDEDRPTDDAGRMHLHERQGSQIDAGREQDRRPATRPSTDIDRAPGR